MVSAIGGKCLYISIIIIIIIIIIIHSFVIFSDQR